MPSVTTHDYVSQLSCHTITTIDELAIYDDTGTYTCSEREDDEILHSPGYAVGHFSESRSIGIIGHMNRYSSETLGEHPCNGHTVVMSPGEVGSHLYTSVEVIAVRCANTHPFNLFKSTDLFNACHQRSDCIVDIIISFGIAPRPHRNGFYYVAFVIYNSENGVGTSKVKTYCVWFAHCF